MTSPSQEVKPLTKEERETLAAVATETIAMELQPAFGEIIDAGDVAEARWRLRYEATIRELESRVSPGVATAIRPRHLGWLCPICYTWNGDGIESCSGDYDDIPAHPVVQRKDGWLDHVATYIEVIKALRAKLDDILNRNGLDVYVEAMIEQGVASRSSGEGAVSDER